MKRVRNTFVLALAILSVISLGSVAGTYAKYTSSFEGTTDSARVAKWAFEITGFDETTNKFNFNLFDTINDSDGTSLENDVKKENDPTKPAIIAPGTTGEFSLVLTNNSEVNAEYNVDYVVNTNGIPVEFKVGDGDWKTSLDEAVPAPLPTIDAGASKTITIQWRWAFERGTEQAEKDTNNGNDTTLGKDGTATLSVQAIVTATQKD